MKHFISGRWIAEDTETTGLSTWKGDAPYAFSFCNDEGQKEYFEFPVDPMTREVLYRKRPSELKALRRLHTDPRVTIVMHNAKHDVRMIRHNVGPFHCKLEETMFAVHSCRSDELTYGLKPLAKKYAGYDDEDLDRLHKATVKLRRKAKKLGWPIHPDVEADYWLCRYAVDLLGDTPEAREMPALIQEYCVSDAERTMLLWLFFKDKMEEDGVLKSYRAEMRLWPVVYKMEERGVRIDPAALKQLDQAYAKDESLHAKAIMEAGNAALRRGFLRNKAGDKLPCFNPNSHVQLAKVLYDYLELSPPGRRYQKNKRKVSLARPTDQDTLLALSASSELPDHILKHRAAAKARQMLGSYRSYMVKDDYWKLHADFNQVGPKTGRFSCRRPALQQAASKSTGRSRNPIDVRAPFGPAPGCVWYSIDYSQLEVRIFADLAQEETMLKLIRSGQHIHQACANHVWGTGAVARSDEAVAVENAIYSLALNRKEDTAEDSEAAVATREAQRKYKGKTDYKTARSWLEAFDWDIVAAEDSLHKKNTTNKSKLAIFTRLFGGGIPSIMNLMKCSQEYASQFLREYGDAFPGMQPWIELTTREGRREGCVWTAFGRRIAVDPNFAYRGVNYRVQGSAADLMKRAMVNCDRYLRVNNVRGWLIMTIHDELVFEFERDHRRMEHVRNLCRIMEDHGGVFGLEMPTACEVVTQRWVDKKKVRWVKIA